MTPLFQEAPISQSLAPLIQRKLTCKIRSVPESSPVSIRLTGIPGRMVDLRGGKQGWKGRTDSQILRIPACKTRPTCEDSFNRPATPLHKAHQGGCFMYDHSWEGGGL